MGTFLIIIAVIAAVYLYAAVAHYYGFKNWYPMCGCKSGVCETKKPAESGTAAGQERS